MRKDKTPPPSRRDKVLSLRDAFHRYNLPDKRYLDRYLRKLIDAGKISIDDTIETFYGKLVSKEIRSDKMLEAVCEIVSDLNTDDSVDNICRDMIAQLDECKNAIQQNPKDLYSEIIYMKLFLEKFRARVIDLKK